MQNEDNSQNVCPDPDVNKEKCPLPTDGCKDPEPCTVKKQGNALTIKDDPCDTGTGEKKVVPKPPICPQVIGPCGIFNKPVNENPKSRGYKCNAKGDKFNPCAPLSKAEGAYDDDDEEDDEDDDE